MRVLGRYELTERLGRGGMGEVWRARDPVLRRDVAIKVLRREGRDDRDTMRDEFVQRFMREARAAASLKHPNVVAIHDVGVDTEPYIVMEYVEGTTLRAFIGKSDVPVATRLAWLVEIASALAAAHDLGLVHRDVKPDNVMITKDGHAKVLDFGIAKAIGGDDDAPPASNAEAPASFRTQHGRVVGTPRYMAPEQLRGEKIDARVDQWAWACVAYELLVGSMPEREETPLPISLTIPEVPFDVAAAIVRARSPDPERRFPSMQSLLSAISTGTTSERASLLTSAESAARNPDAPTTTGPAARKPNRTRVAIVAAASFALAASVVFAARVKRPSEAAVAARASCTFARLPPFPMPGEIHGQGVTASGSILMSFLRYDDDASDDGLRQEQVMTIATDGVTLRLPPPVDGFAGNSPQFVFPLATAHGAVHFVGYNQGERGHILIGRTVASDDVVDMQRIARSDTNDFEPTFIVPVLSPASTTDSPVFIVAGLEREDTGLVRAAVRLYGEHVFGATLFRSDATISPSALVAVADKARIAYAFVVLGKLYVGAVAMSASVAPKPVARTWAAAETKLRMDDSIAPRQVGDCATSAAIALDGTNLHVLWTTSSQLHHAVLRDAGTADSALVDSSFAVSTDETMPGLRIDGATTIVVWRDSAHLFFGQGPDVESAVRSAASLSEADALLTPWMVPVAGGTLLAWIGGAPHEVRRAVVTCK